MKPLYKHLLIIGIALGVVATSLIIGVGQTLVMQMKRLPDPDQGYYAIQHVPERNIIQGMSLPLSRQIQEWLPSDTFSTLITRSIMTDGVQFGDEFYSADLVGVDPEYIQVVSGELLKGRFFDDESVTQRVCVVTADIYRLFGEDNLTSVVVNDMEFEVIGVIQRQQDISDMFTLDFSSNSIFFPVEILYADVVDTDPLSGMVLQVAVDSRGHSQADLQKLINENLKEMADAPVIKVVAPGDSSRSEQARALLILAAIFAVAAIVFLLAGLNIIQIASANVIDQQRSYGLRVALGASPRQIVREVSGEILRCALQGGYLGIVISGLVNTAINRYVGTYWAAFNLLTVFTGIVLACFVGWITSLIPAQRAAKLDPVTVLRQEG